MVDTLIGVALAVALTGAFVFAVLYTWKARWVGTPMGRHMFYFAWSFVATAATNLLRLWVQNPVIDFVRVLSLFLVAVVFWQRVYLLVQSLRGGRRGT